MPAPKTPLLTADGVVLDTAGRVLLVRRRHQPFQGMWALPGGFVERDESVEDACRREVLEETGVRLRKLELIGVYSEPGRDPRGPTCTVAYLARVRDQEAVSGDDAASAEWVSDWRKRPLAFDHLRIIADAIKLARQRSSEGVRRPRRH